jgi:hypothetical protein
MKTITITLCDEDIERLEALKNSWFEFIKAMSRLDANILERDCIFTDEQMLRLSLKHTFDYFEKFPVVDPEAPR